MKKLVPDPPIPYISIIDHLPLAEVWEHAAALMAMMTRNCEVYLAFADDERPDILVDNISILSQLLSCLMAHARSLEEPS
ncbi:MULTISPECIES: hypothetical protein [Pseudomonas]|uniref:Uncharacterized protein n=1 Tax=Pseudomonas soli TaxID=1306993 RepID=A0A2V4HX06_9PSED|nr:MULTISPECIES: hypothetical protein [Pseudomonas]PYB81749.1 hypothetical protein DMX07_13505 [Pseudomonas soli]PZW86403.1 hypothetical protein DFS21_101157 [Pseudomonas sp. 2848]